MSFGRSAGAWAMLTGSIFDQFQIASQGNEMGGFSFH
jgi:hypothetical protein